MSFVPFNKVSCVAVGEDLHVARVSCSAWRVRVHRGPVVRGFARMGVEEARRALAGLEGGGRVVLTLWSGACGVRPIQLGMRRWGAARSDVVRSIGRLFPLGVDEALVGLIERTTADDGASGESGERGYLVAAARREVSAWTAALERALGREVGEVLSPQMAMLGLGLQHEGRAGVIERSASGGEEIHWLRYGEVEELGAAWSSEMDDAAEIGGGVLRRLPGTGSVGAQEVDGFELAIGAALAPVVAAGRFAPLVGKASGAPRRWVAPVAATAASLLMLWGAGAVLEGRYERAIADARAEAVRMSAELARVQGMRKELGEKTALLEEGIEATVAGWGSIMPDFAAAHGAVPTGGFLYEIRLDGGRVFLRGEAPRASDVLRALDASRSFDEARQEGRVAQVDERGTETFDLVARRVSAGGSEGGGSR